ncbi:MAG: 16S rRNA (cytosine(1402)-N(4))-methyltransferase RsmH [Alphaproteobacteria bacterium]|nr:16S rRNA (cytosine(1402)-N(4))-methyltransferase RsmH [Alphaproteobacteria bacterium]
MTVSAHIPVMLTEMLAALEPRDGAVYVDGTFGRGGYTAAILDAADCTVWAIDRDPDAVAHGGALSERYAQRLTVLHGRFGDMLDVLRRHGVDKVDGIVLDLGLSSPQLDRPERGFSFRADGPLDLRMDAAGPTAADLVNSLDERALADIIRGLGEERHARRVARAIVEARRDAPIMRTGALAEIVRRVVPRSKDGLDPATRTFMALRLHVNDELGELDRGLEAAEHLLAPGGRLIVVSFHSLEDRRVKRFLQRRSGRGGGGSRHAPMATTPPAPSFTLLQRRAATPRQSEIQDNPRARSARLRAAERTGNPAWPPQPERIAA